MDILQPPPVSVLLPVYNGERYLRQAIASICNQSWSDFELIVVDDGSTDSTPAILAEAVAQDARLVLLRHSENQGLVAALNHGLANAHGQYIARQDADDWSLPDRLRKQVQFLNAHPQVVLLGSAAFFEAGGVAIHEAPIPAIHPAVLGWRQTFTNHLIHTSVVFRRRAVMAIGGYSAQFPHTEDYELWSRLNDGKSLAILPEQLVTHRRGIGVATLYADANRTGTLQIMHRSITTLLQRPVAWAEIEALYAALRARPIADARLVWRVAQLLQALCPAYIRHARLAAEEVRLVQIDLQQQMRRLVRSRKPLPTWLRGYLAGAFFWEKAKTTPPHQLARQSLGRIGEKFRERQSPAQGKPAAPRGWQDQPDRLARFEDVAGDPIVFVAGSGRSGTTWLQEIINYRGDYRIIFEPLRPERMPGCSVSLLPHWYLRPGDEQAVFVQSAQTLLQGDLRSWWTDQFNGPGRYQRRLIKEIRGHLLLQWLYQLQPTLKLVFIMRHPCAVVTSQLAQKWPTGEAICASFLAQSELMEDFLHPFAGLLQQSYEPFLQRLLVWAVENYVPLHQFAPEQLHLIFYEDLCTTPMATLERLYAFLDLPMPANPARVIQLPSVLATAESAIRRKTPLLDGWRNQLEPRQVRQAVDLLAHFGLDQIYHDDLHPNRQAAEQCLCQNRQDLPVIDWLEHKAIPAATDDLVNHVTQVR